MESEEAKAKGMLPRCTVRGYEINAQYHGNPLRYVRYAGAGTAQFVRVPRPSGGLSHWRLQLLDQQPAKDRYEVTLTYPDGDWRFFLFTGYPHTFKKAEKSQVINSNYINDCYGVKAFITPLHVRSAGEVNVLSPLPILPPRISKPGYVHRQAFENATT